MENKPSKLSILTKGIIKENPVLVLLLGTCPTLATTSSAINGIGMGVSAMAVLICSNIVISLLRKIIPDNVRIPCYIVVIAGFVTVVQLLLQAFVPSLYASLGLFIPLIVVNCIILGRAEMFARFRTGRYRHGYRFHHCSGHYGSDQRILRKRYTVRCRSSDRHRSGHGNLQSGSGRILRIRMPDCRCKLPDQRKGSEEERIWL